MTAQQQASVLADLTAADFTLTSQYSFTPGLAGLLTKSGAGVLDCHQDVLRVEPDYEVSFFLTESVPLIGADQVQLEGLTGAGVNVAVHVKVEAIQTYEQASGLGGGR